MQGGKKQLNAKAVEHEKFVNHFIMSSGYQDKVESTINKKFY